MKNFSDDFAVKTLENADSDYISNILAGLENNPDQLDSAIDIFMELYYDTIAETLEKFSKSKSKDSDDLTEDELGEYAIIVSGPFYDAFMHVLMVGQNVPGLYDISHPNLSFEDFSNITNNWDKMNFDAKLIKRV